MYTRTFIFQQTMVIGCIDDFRLISITTNRNTSMNDPPDLGASISVNQYGEISTNTWNNSKLSRLVQISYQRQHYRSFKDRRSALSMWICYNRWKRFGIHRPGSQCGKNGFGIIRLQVLACLEQLIMNWSGQFTRPQLLEILQGELQNKLSN